MSTPFVYLEPSEPEVSESTWVARLASSREEAEYHSPCVLTFEEYMAMSDAPALVL